MYAITTFGDSITFGSGDNINRGWCDRLKKYFESKGEHHYLYNLGISGDTSSDILERFDAESKARVKFKREQDRNIILFSIGTNDSKLKGKEKTPKVEFDVFSKNIQTLINKAKTYTKEVAFIGLIPVDEKLAMNYENTVLTNERISLYNNKIEEICKINDVPFFNIYPEFLKLSYEKLLFDGLHPNSAGYEKMYELIKTFLIQKQIID
jgi:lysophospholipase L1-like esterase